MPRIIGGTAVGWVELDFFNSFEPGDFRKEVSFWTSVNKDGKTIPWQNWSDPFPHVGKYKDGGPNVNIATGESSTNLPIMRYTEVLLIYAEALNELNGPTPEAYAAINKVRRRAFKEDINAAAPQPNDLPAGLSQADFRDAVLQERAWELCYEWRRWFDLVRTNRLIVVMKPSKPFVEEKHYLYPIPQSQIDVNPNLTQNPGY